MCKCWTYHCVCSTEETSISRNSEANANYSSIWTWTNRYVICPQNLQSINVSFFRFCALGIFTLVLCWATAGVHLGTAVVSIYFNQ